MRLRLAGEGPNVQKWVPYSQRYLVLGLVGLALWLVSGISLNKYRCEYGTHFCEIAGEGMMVSGVRPCLHDEVC